jgi:hypothetical protein
VLKVYVIWARGKGRIEAIQGRVKDKLMLNGKDLEV